MCFEEILTNKTKGCFFPDIVTVRGRNEETRRLHKKRLGDYIRDTEETSELRPVWKQQNGDHILSYTPQKEWAVSLRNKLLNRQDMVIKYKDKGSLPIPLSGWMTQDSKMWKINMELEVQGMFHFSDLCMYLILLYCRIHFSRNSHHQTNWPSKKSLCGRRIHKNRRNC